MSEFKKYLPKSIIQKVTEEGYEGFLELTTVYPIAEARKSGEILLYLLKIGLSPIEIDQMLNLRIVTIEARVIEYLKELEEKGNNTYEEVKFIFENVKGLKYFDIYKRFIFSNFDEKNFCKRECLTENIFKNMKKKLDLKGVKEYEKEILYKKEQENLHNSVINYLGTPLKYGTYCIKLG